MIGRRSLLIAACAALLGTTVQAQSSGAEGGTVSGVGTVSLKRRPDTLRLKVELFARGKTMKDALANLKDRRDALRGQLATLGARKDSVAFGEPQVTSQLQEARQQMMAMMQGRMGNRIKKDANKNQPEPAVVSASLTAEWTLKGQDTEALLIEVGQLEDAVNKADIAGAKELEKLSGDDEESREEMAGMAAMMGNADPNRGQPGKPTFTLVSKLSAQDHAQALAAAFRKAKTAAEDTAKAAGAQLGTLHHVQSQVHTGGEAENANEMAMYYARVFQGGATAPQADPENSLEAVGQQPGAVVYKVAVTASFILKPGQ